MNTIESIIMAHRYLYYVEARPIISDYEYDMLERRALREYPDSPILNSTGIAVESLVPDEIKVLASILSGRPLKQKP